MLLLSCATTDDLYLELVTWHSEKTLVANCSFNMSHR